MEVDFSRERAWDEEGIPRYLSLSLSLYLSLPLSLPPSLLSIGRLAFACDQLTFSVQGLENLVLKLTCPVILLRQSSFGLVF
jgi:hypothetical protein